MHIGGLYTAGLALPAQFERRQFFLRIEDTDKKREVEGTVDLIPPACTYGLSPDEGDCRRAGTGRIRPLPPEYADLLRAACAGC
jgi:glutamyl/glutaminyl-tRNA synthetase